MNKEFECTEIPGKRIGLGEGFDAFADLLSSPGAVKTLRCRSLVCKCSSFHQAWDCANSEVGSRNPGDSASARQVGGDHYATKTVQPWDAMQAWMTAEAFEGFLAGNAIKYLARYRDKGGRADVEKAAHYLQKLLEVMV